MAKISPSKNSINQVPTSSADCHISSVGARPTDDLLLQAVHSQVLLWLAYSHSAVTVCRFYTAH